MSGHYEARFTGYGLGSLTRRRTCLQTAKLSTETLVQQSCTRFVLTRRRLPTDSPIRFLRPSAYKHCLARACFYGKLPRAPPEDAQPREQGIYALFLMLLFRPHRDFRDIVRLSTRNCPNVGAEDEIWTALDTEYRRWRVEDVQERGKLYRSGADQDARVGSSGWWACLIHEKLRNYEAAMRRHHGESLTVPDDIGKLPVYPDNHRPTENTTAHSGDESDKSSCMSVDMPEVSYAPEGEKQGRRTNTGVPDPLATCCGVLPHV